MIFWIVMAVLWVTLSIVAFTFAKKAGEKEWGQFAAVNLVPFIGALLSIMIYAIEIGQKDEKRNL